MKFSQRLGFAPATKSIQLDSMDDDLRVGLWNIYRTIILSMFDKRGSEDLKQFFMNTLWHNFFKWNIDTIPEFYSLTDKLHEYFFSKKTEWYEVYDFIEFSATVGKIIFKDDSVLNFYKSTNIVLEREFSAYRFIDGILAPITNDHEISEIEIALNNTFNFSHLTGANVHLTQALHLLSDKTNPDYRNSIKESISAIESVAKIIAANKKDELSTALSILKEKAKLNAGLVAGIKSIYGWTSNSNGIRHGLMDEPNCDFDDAKYMLVSSSAFVNYLIGKSQKAGIAIN